MDTKDTTGVAGEAPHERGREGASAVGSPAVEVVRVESRRRALGKAAEFFVIVSSILVALAGDAWWDTRVERREEREALMALRGEFTASLRTLQAGERVHERSAEAIQRILQWTGPDPKLPGGDTLATELFDAVVRYSTYNDRRGVLDGVIASGALRLIQNDSLRARLAGWPAVVEDLTEDEVLALELRNGELAPYVYRQVPIDGSDFPRDYGVLFSDPYFERLIDWRYRQLEVIMDAYDVAIAELEAIIESIDAELGTRGDVLVGDSVDTRTRASPGRDSAR
jgi:hypothetical protein